MYQAGRKEGICIEVSVETIGIDVGKKNLYVVLIIEDRVISKEVANSTTGIAALLKWLKSRKIARTHICLEASGGWSEGVATVLHDAGHKVSIVNPSRIKAFAQSEMMRTKTDRIDAALIARFCRMHVPEAWTPAAPEIQALLGLVRRHDGLLRMRADEQNRLEAPIVTPHVRASIEATLEHYNAEIIRVEDAIAELFERHPKLSEQRALLVSIPGIGATTAARIIGEMPNIVEFHGSKAVAAFAGLSPRHYESGSIRWPSRLSKSGNANLRRALYFPAITAIRYNPTLKIFAARLKARGKSNMTIIAAVMRKLLVLAYGVLKSRRIFDPTFASA